MGAGLIALLACKEVARSIASDELSSAGWERRLAIKLHLLMCRHCRRYARQLRAIGEATRRIFGDGQPDPDSRERLRSSILDQLPSGAVKDRDSRV